MTAKTRRRLSDLELASVIGKAVADALEPRFQEIALRLTSIDGSVGAMRVDIAEMKGEISEMKGDISEMKGDVSEMKGDIAAMRKVDIERHLDLDQRLRRVERHLNLD